MEISGRLALVTGGAKRVGKEVALMLAQQGADVVIHFHNSEAEAALTTQDIRGWGVRGFAIDADLSASAEVASLIDSSIRLAGRAPSILVNSASGFRADTLSAELPLEWDQSLAESLLAPVILMGAFAERLDGAQGAIVNLTDVRVDRPYPGRFSYIVAKGGLATATKAAAIALAPTIRVNAVAPWLINDPPGSEPGLAARLSASTPLAAVGGEGAVAHAVRFLVENDHVTGVVLPVDGGYSLMNPMTRPGLEESR